MRQAPLLILVAACVPSPPELCKRGVDLECTRQFECQSDGVKASEGFQGGWGISLESCNTKVAAQAHCDDKVTQNDLCTGENAGKKFDLGAASQCSSERRAQSCADFLDPEKLPSVCNQRCR